MSSPVPDSAWFRDARFGLFIHWGLYSIPAGVWQGRTYDEHLGEWIKWHAKIPLADYDRLAEQFNPEGFDARAWVRLAQQAGMRYLVFTTKHSDGFAMWHTRTSPRNIVDASPWGRDPVRELSEACAEAGMPFGIYYSHALDWSSPFAAQHWIDPEAHTRDMARHFREVTYPQLTELLTGYGPLAVVWFDVPFLVTPELAEELRAFVHRLQPSCLINGRIGPIVSDYLSFGDNLIPESVQSAPGETCATINNTWGYKTHDEAWKSPAELLETLLDLTAKNTTYLLNVGPRGDGRFPEPAIAALETVGAWLHAHADAVYGAVGIPGWSQPAGARLLRKGERWFLHVLQPDQPITLDGLVTPPVLAWRFANPIGAPVSFTHADNTLHLEALGGSVAPGVVELAFATEPTFLPATVQTASGLITLPASDARVIDADTSTSLNPLGRVSDIAPRPGKLAWTFTVLRPGRYSVSVQSIHSGHRENGARWQGGQHLLLRLADQTLETVLRADEALATPQARYYDEVLSHVPGALTLTAGDHTLTLERTDSVSGLGDELVKLRLTPLP